MRVKFESPRIPTDQERKFISYISGTGDSYGISEDLLSTFCGSNNRTIRKWKERYNNFLYIDIIPKGEIHNINGLYKLVRISSKYRTRYIYQANYNLITSAIAKRNTSKILGNIQAIGQLNMNDLLNMESSELVELALQYENVMKEEVME